jgi:hypothetical protein
MEKDKEVPYYVSVEITEDHCVNNGRWWGKPLVKFFPEKSWTVQATVGEKFTITLDKPATIPAHRWTAIRFQLDVS